MDAILASFAEKSIIAFSFIWLLQYFLTTFTKALQKITTTLEKISRTLVSMDSRMSEMEKRIEKLETKEVI